MSVASKNSSHRRNDSGELVVFEAARYFSGGDENPCYHNSSAARDEGRRTTAAARMSLDMAAINLPTIQKQYLMREKMKKQKQPSSPGGRLASFINSLFNQTNSKKKKKSKTSTVDVDDDHHHTLDQRRSSISHFTITTSAANYDSNSSSAKTPTKSSYKDMKSFSDRQKAEKSGGGIEVNEQFGFNNGSFRNPTTKWTSTDDEDQRVLRKFDDVDDGQDSDSSSDLFDLPNLDFYSSGLPVYGTTNMDRIRIGAPIARAAAV